MERVISRLEEWIVVIVLSIMSTIAFVNIVSRGLIGYSFSFAEEDYSELVRSIDFRWNSHRCASIRTPWLYTDLRFSKFSGQKHHYDSRRYLDVAFICHSHLLRYSNVIVPSGNGTENAGTRMAAMDVLDGDADRGGFVPVQDSASDNQGVS